MKRNMICVTCPRGCRLQVVKDGHGKLTVSGNFCARGVKYAQIELSDPRRMIASTVRVRNGIHAVVPVATDQPIPKALILDAMALLKRVVVDAPIRMGDVILPDVLASGVNIVASRDLAGRDAAWSP